MAEVKVIKANASILDRKQNESKGILRVAAYARVSTGSEEQLTSYESQRNYYKELIEGKPEWKMVDVYADEAITGTTIDKRVDFKRMLNDALSGKMDMIITKSISRFARNTVDTLKYVRELKEKHVAVFFEEENINTLSMDGELLLTILSSVAQQEVQNISEHVKLGLKMRMQKGQLVGFNRCLGYDYHKDTKTITVNEKEAEIVRYIFKRYIQGAGANMICRELTDLGYAPPKKIRNNLWNPTTIIGIIKNEKYIGDIRQGKTFTLDPISKRRLDNMGESDQFYLENHHEAIISREIFAKANELIEQRACPRRWGNQYDREYIPRRYAFSSMCECGFCHSNLSRKIMNKGATCEHAFWQCTQATKLGKIACSRGLSIHETCLEKAFEAAFKMITQENSDTLIDSFISIIESSIMNTSPMTKIKTLEGMIKDLESRKDKILDLRINGVVSKEECEEKYTKVSSELEIKKAELARLNLLSESQREIKERITNFKKTITEQGNMDRFSREVFENLVEKVIVGGVDKNGKVDPHLLNFVLKSSSKPRPIANAPINVDKLVRFHEFQFPYRHFFFDVNPDGSKSKRLELMVNVVLSIDFDTSI